jgi:MFS family permease
VRANSERTSGVSASTMAALMAVFTVSVGYGVVLPLLPYLIEQFLGAGVEAAPVSRHTGLLTAVYTVSLFLFAPMWGQRSDRRGTPSVLLVGLIGFGAHRHDEYDDGANDAVSGNDEAHALRGAFVGLDH